MIRAVLTVMAASTLVNSPVLGGTDEGYRIAQSIPAAGGSLQVLEDARLTPGLARKLWRAGVDPVSVLGEDNPDAQPFKTEPLRPARLRQVAAAGSVILDTVLATTAPIARIEARRLGRASRPIYLVTTDDDAGFGSYSGRATQLYAPQGKRLQPVLARDSSGRIEKIVLVDTLKSGWRIAEARSRRTVIHQLLCRPDPENQKSSEGQAFLLTYVTYQYDGVNWRRAQRVSPGFWENDEPWPARKKFPPIPSH